LFYPAQSLYIRMFEQVKDEISRDLYKSVDRVIYNFSFVES